MTPLLPSRLHAHVLVIAALPLLLLLREPPRPCPHPLRDTRLVIRSIEAAVVHFQMDHGDRCPASLAELVEQKILVKVPLDTWGQPMLFMCPGAYNSDGADIVSAGRDGIFGTADDVLSWEL